MYNPDGSFFGTQYQNTGFNIVAQRASTYQSKDFRTNGNVYLNYKISKELSFRTENGLDLLNQTESRYESNINRYFTGKDYTQPKPYPDLAPIGLATAGERQYQVINVNTNNYFTFKKDFGPKNVFDATLGFIYQRANQSQVAYSASGGGVGFINTIRKVVTT